MHVGVRQFKFGVLLLHVHRNWDCRAKEIDGEGRIHAANVVRCMDFHRNEADWYSE